MATSRSRMPAARRTGSARAPSERAPQLSLGHPAVLISVTTLALVGLGLVMILSASSVSSYSRYGSSFTFFNRQAIWAVIGIIVFSALARTDYRRFKRLGFPAYVAALLFLAAVEVPGLGVVVGGSARWLQLGPLSFQPSEVAKLALILLAAEAFARKGEDALKHPVHTLLPLIPAFGALALLVLAQPDMGTMLILGAIAVGMLFVAGAPFRYLLPLGLIGLAGAVAAALYEPYRRERVLAFLDPWADPLNTGYQTIQSLIALGSGGWFGVGLGASRQKWSYIPNAHTDFIFSILGEETGLVGTLLVVGMFAFLAFLGVRAARSAPDRYGMLVAAGVTVWIAAQAIVNIGAVSATLPVTGVPLPLISFGGTSLVITLAALGLLVSVARQGRPPGVNDGASRKARS
jgi:cell division protein FtsW